MRWRDLPSLSLLRAFDATARHGSFAEAGRALNVTHAAVTQAVRGLEAELGVTLVQRAGRTVALTEAGKRLAQSLGEGFGAIAAGVADLRQTEARRVLRVATTTFIAETHVLPRLADFWAKHPGIEVAMTPSPASVDLGREGFDLAIRVLEEGWVEPEGLEIRRLIRTPLLATCAPQLADLDPMEIPWLDGPGTAWDREQLRKAGIDPDALRKVQFGSPHLEMSAARQGLGAMLATEIICRADLEAGRLVVLPVEGLPFVDYVAVMPQGPRRPAVEAFAGWLATIF
ncbi:MAG: LysR substrate-binding domain-containing protein [Tabrizicola sp.]|jgi:LysR family glycine cleavage system transcriptional activator|nr:LysR substrate-binding domain-containing protein [Tabrizicola sp.]